MVKSGINERYVRQCLEANRHNEATAYYYLMVKTKQLDGEDLDADENGDSQQYQNDQIITAASQLRLHKSVAAPRTSKNANHHQLRKIAEGLGDLKTLRMTYNSRDNSVEKPK